MGVQPAIDTQAKSEWKILIIDDDEDDYFIARDMLRQARGRKMDVHWASTYAAGRDELINNQYNAVLVDYDLGLHSGIDLIREASERGAVSPLILYTGRGSFEVDIEAMEAGATMYLTKGEVNPLLLERAIRYAIEIKQKERDLREARETTERELAERKRAEEALHRIEARWNAAIESFEVGAIIATEDEQVIYWNPAARQMHGFTQPDEGIEPLEKTPITFQLWTLDGSHLLALDEWPMRRIKRGETVRNLELRIRRPDQGWEKVFSYSGMMVDTAGGERLIFLTCQDRTENHRAEDALRESEARLRLALTAARMVAWEFNPATRAVTFSENAEEVLELPRRHQNSDEGYNLIHPDDVESHRARVNQAISTGGSYASVYRHAHGERTLWLEEHGQAVVDSSGKTLRLVGVVQNITARKAAEDALQQALAEAEEGRQTLNALMEYIPEGISIAEGTQATIRMVSRYGQELLGGVFNQMTVEQVVDEWKVYEEDGITPLADEDLPLVRAIQKGEVIKNQDLVQMNSCGQRLSLSCSAGPIRNASGKITGGVVAWREVSERKQLVDQLRESNQALLKMQEQLRQQKDRLERLIQHAPAGIAFQSGPDYVYTLVNQEYMRFAQGKGELIGRGVAEVWPEIADIILPQYDHVFKTGEPVSVMNAPLTIIRDGVPGIEYFTYTHTPVMKADGSIEGVMTLAIDTTQSVQNRQVAETQSDRLEAVLQALPVGVWITDLQGRILGKNEQSDRIWAGDAPLSESMAAYAEYVMLDPATRKHRPLEEYPLVQVLRTGQPVAPQENLIQRFDHSQGYAMVSAAPIKDRNGQLTGAVAIMLDIDQRKQTEDVLRESEQKSREILESISDGFFSFDREWRVNYVNPQAGEQGGYRAEDLIGTMIWESVPQLRGSNLEAVYRRVMEEREPETTEFHSPRSGKWFRLRVYPSAVGISVFSVDITAEKQAEVELERSNQALQDFAFIASHDLQEPLRKITMFGNNLRRHLGDTPDETTRDTLERMLNAADRMQAMITGLLDLSRINARGRVFQPVHLTQIVEEVVADLELRIRAVKGKVTIGELPVIEADELQMRQLFQNLITNAIKFHKRGVSPLVRVTGTVDPTSPAHMVEIHIADNGIGFAPEETGRVFQPFQRLHSRSEYEGTGLGLAICQKIVERHQGTLEVESAPGKGSTFIIRLPTG